ALVAKDCRPLLVDQLKLGQRHFPMPGQVRRLSDRVAERPRGDFLDEQGIQRSSQICCKSQAFCRTLAANERGELQQSIGRISRWGYGLPVHGLERAADTLADVRIANGNESGEQQAAAACSDESLGDGTHRPVVGEKDASARETQRVVAE